MPLGDAQRSVAESTEPLVLVIGGAGTGKTTAALWAAATALSRAGVQPWKRALVLTFSRTAVSQLRSRLLSDAELDPSLAAHVEIATFHSFAYQLVRAFGAPGLAVVPRMRSRAEQMLRGEAADEFGYDDLIPSALKTVARTDVQSVLKQRWELVICDEFQDTSDQEWTLLETLGSWSRLLLMADPNQTIYEGLPGKTGVGDQRIEAVRATARVIELPNASYRDATNLIPALAEEVRTRNFEGPALQTALAEGRLRVLHYDGTEPARLDAIAEAVRALPGRGIQSAGIFLQGNVPVAEMSEGLADRNIQHLLVGLNEAHGEAIGAMAGLTAFGAGVITSAEARAKLAAFVVASRRQRDVPDFARYLVGRGNITAQTLKDRVVELEERLRSAADDHDLLIGRAASFWPDLSIRSGESEWHRAIGTFRSLARFAASQGRDQRRAIEQLLVDCEQARAEGLTGFEEIGNSPVRLMNFHQTKGREADATILVFYSNDYFGPNEGEPYPKLSRLLYVAFTRARREIVVLLPPDPHAAIAPVGQL